MKDLRSDFDSLTMTTSPAEGNGRRRFMRGALGAGFAAATLPTLAQSAISTSSEGLTVGEVMIKVDGFDVPVYRAQPAGRTGLPVVLVISEIFGVHEYVADVARRFARQGYLALAPELFVRQGDASSLGTMAEILREIVGKTPDAQVMRDLDAVLVWAGANGGDLKRAGITGFCWGGRITWLYAAHNPALKAGVAWYGRLNGDRNAMTPSHAIDAAASLKVPVLGLYGGKDAGIPLDSVEAMKTRLATGKSGSEFFVYPDAPHAFHADYRPSYVEAAAKDGWQRCLQWFKRHGVA